LGKVIFTIERVGRGEMRVVHHRVEVLEKNGLPDAAGANVGIVKAVKGLDNKRLFWDGPFLGREAGGDIDENFSEAVFTSSDVESSERRAGLEGEGAGIHGDGAFGRRLAIEEDAAGNAIDGCHAFNQGGESDGKDDGG
jgi:hypothetical protein